MKTKYFSVFTAAIIIAVTWIVTSCSADNADITPTEESEGQYLVMFYGVGGKNLDKYILANVLQSLAVGSSDKVKITYQYRFSRSLQDKGDNYRCIRRFTADKNSHLKGTFNAIDTTTSNADFVYNTWEDVNTSCLGDESYVMASDTALTSFIKWSRIVYPQTTKTLLIIADHGGGWSLVDDGIRDNATRGILFDGDNVKGSFLSLDDVVRGISNAGQVDALFEDACLMSTWENIAGYRQAANYFLSSLEVAPGPGGNYYYLIKRLQDSSNVSDEALRKALEDYTDDVVDKWWAYNEQITQEEDQNDSIFSDLNVIDLQQIGPALLTISSINKTLAEKWNSTEVIPGVSEEAELGDLWRSYIRSAITSCVCATSCMSSHRIAFGDIPEPMKDMLKASVEKDSVYYQDVLKALQTIDMSHEPYEYIQQYQNVWSMIAGDTFDSYSLANLLCQLNRTLRGAGVADTDNPFAALYKQYILALKTCSYIRCTHALSVERAAQYGMTSYEYDTCSPGVFIYPLNPELYNNPDVFGKRYCDAIPYVNTAVSCYHHTAFDHQTSWSTFLQLIDVLPNVIINPSRESFN